MIDRYGNSNFDAAITTTLLVLAFIKALAGQAIHRFVVTQWMGLVIHLPWRC